MLDDGTLPGAGTPGVAADDIPVSGSQLPTVGHPLGCPGCGVTFATEGLRDRLYVCTCGHHVRLHADAWIALIADGGAWKECWDGAQTADVLGWQGPKPYRQAIVQACASGLNEAVRTGWAMLCGRPLWLAVFDFRFIGGTLSIVAGERLVRGIEEAIDRRIPYVLISASGGARMQEGLLALVQMAKVNAAVGRLHRAGVPFFSVLTDPTFGGTSASLALLADVNIAEPGAQIGFSGARVIRQATYADLPEGFQTAAFQLRCGQLDMIVSRLELRETLVRLADFYWYCRRDTRQLAGSVANAEPDRQPRADGVLSV